MLHLLHCQKGPRPLRRPDCHRHHGAGQSDLHHHVQCVHQRVNGGDDENEDIYNVALLLDYHYVNRIVSHHHHRDRQEILGESNDRNYDITVSWPSCWQKRVETHWLYFLNLM